METYTIEVKIIKCSKSTFWYKERIGQTFEVEEYSGNLEGWYQIVGEKYLLLKEDCEIVEGE